MGMMTKKTSSSQRPGLGALFGEESACQTGIRPWVQISSNYIKLSMVVYYSNLSSCERNDRDMKTLCPCLWQWGQSGKLHPDSVEDTIPNVLSGAQYGKIPDVDLWPLCSCKRRWVHLHTHEFKYMDPTHDKQGRLVSYINAAKFPSTSMAVLFNQSLSWGFHYSSANMKSFRPHLLVQSPHFSNSQSLWERKHHREVIFIFRWRRDHMASGWVYEHFPLFKMLDENQKTFMPFFFCWYPCVWLRVNTQIGGWCWVTFAITFHHWHGGERHVFFCFCFVFAEPGIPDIIWAYWIAGLLDDSWAYWTRGPRICLVFVPPPSQQ